MENAARLCFPLSWQRSRRLRRREGFSAEGSSDRTAAIVHGCLLSGGNDVEWKTQPGSVSHCPGSVHADFGGARVSALKGLPIGPQPLFMAACFREETMLNGKRSQALFPIVLAAFTQTSAARGFQR